MRSMRIGCAARVGAWFKPARGRNVRQHRQTVVDPVQEDRYANSRESRWARRYQEQHSPLATGVGRPAHLSEQVEQPEQADEGNQA